MIMVIVWIKPRKELEIKRLDSYDGGNPRQQPTPKFIRMGGSKSPEKSGVHHLKHTL